YPFPLGVTMTHTSQVDLDAPDRARFPRLEAATPYRFTLKSGEMLFMPAFWWHHVRSRGVSISVNYWWSADPRHWVTCQNSLRELFAQYTVDRLASLRTRVLPRSGLTLATAAAVLLRANHRWGAALAAVAAFDHALNSVREQVGVPNGVGCAV